ncbi:MAG: GNAT family N-acetyltransferase [Bdellovibrionales bacterium]|nr:GNAT family N-acetyltransferase [Bdellovibrionales bacterium]
MKRGASCVLSSALFSGDWGSILVRPCATPDIDAVLNYLYRGPQETLISIGIDPQELPGVNAHRVRLNKRVRYRFDLVAAEYRGECISIISLEQRSMETPPRVHFHILKPDMRHQGLGLPIFSAGLKILMRVHKLPSVYVEPKHDNVPMIRLLEKMGGVNRGKGRSGERMTYPFDSIVYELFFDQLANEYRRGDL